MYQYVCIFRENRLSLLLLPVYLFMAAATDLRAHSTHLSAFQDLNGEWSGFGRLGFSNGKTAKVKCHATYNLDVHDNKMHQVVNCANADIRVDSVIKFESRVKYDDKLISGFWSEKKYELTGQISGQFTGEGFWMNVHGQNLKAEKTISVYKDKHIVELRFYDSALIGLSVVFSARHPGFLPE